MGGSDYRFRLFVSDGASAGANYAPIQPDEVGPRAAPSLPALFKPMGSPKPQSSYIASDAGYVDYITELMGGYAVPSFVKARRKGKRYCNYG